MVKNRLFFIMLVLLLCVHSVSAQSKFVERSTDVLCMAPTITGLCVAICDEDRKGAIQLGLSTATTLAANYALEALIKKDRPDGTGHHAFPSTHTAIAFDGATYLMRRKGWKWGVPAYIVSAYVAWGRVDSKRHDWWDVLGGACLGAGAALIYTRPLPGKAELSIAPCMMENGGKGLVASLKF